MKKDMELGVGVAGKKAFNRKRRGVGKDDGEMIKITYMYMYISLYI